MGLLKTGLNQNTQNPIKMNNTNWVELLKHVGVLKSKQKTATE